MKKTRRLLAIICLFAFLRTARGAPSHQTNVISKRNQNPRQLIRRSPAPNSLLPRHPFPQQENDKDKGKSNDKDKDKGKAKEDKDKDKAKEDKDKDKAKEDKDKDKAKDKNPEQGGAKNETEGGTLGINQPPPPAPLTTTVTIQNTPNVQQVPVRSASSPNPIQEAAASLTLATKNVDNAVMILQNPKNNEAEVKKAAQEALKNEASEDFLRQVLASAAQDPIAAQGSLAIIRDKTPTVVNGFKDIIKSAGNPTKVVETLKDVVIARLQVVQANMDLIGGIRGGDRTLIATSQVSPSQAAVGRQLNTAQKKAVEEAQRGLTFYMKKVDEAIANIQKQGVTPPEIEATAKIALVQEAAQDFAREVLASAASNPKAAMEALESVRDHAPNEIIAGWTALASNAKDSASVKKNIELVLKGRESVVPANLKLIELSGGIGGATSATNTPPPPVKAADTTADGTNKNSNEKTTSTAGAGQSNTTAGILPPPSGAKDPNGVSLASGATTNTSTLPPPAQIANLTTEGANKNPNDKATSTSGTAVTTSTTSILPPPPVNEANKTPQTTLSPGQSLTPNGVSLANGATANTSTLPPPAKTADLGVEGGSKAAVDKNGVALAGATTGTLPPPPSLTTTPPGKDPSGLTPSAVDPLKLNSLGTDQAGTTGGMMKKQDPRLLLASQLAAGSGPDSSVLLYGSVVPPKQAGSTNLTRGP